MFYPYRALLFFCLLISTGVSYASGISPVTPVKLTCELLQDPQGIDVSHPGLSYTLKVVSEKERDIRQTAYRILVASSDDFTPGSIVWDSHRVCTDRMAYINYAGKALRSGGKYWWKVQVWDQNGRVSHWSGINTWTMGILGPEAWHAKWISADGAEKYALSPVGFLSKPEAAEDVRKWVQIDLGGRRAFTSICLYPTFYRDRAAYLFPRRFKVEVADEPSFLESRVIADYTAKDNPSPRYAMVRIDLKNTIAHYVRLTVVKMSRQDKIYAYSLRQIEVRSGNKNLAAGKKVNASDSDENNGFSTANLTDRVEDDHTFPNFSSVLLRKEFTVKAKLKRAVIHISGLSQYELRLNGRKTGDQLIAPGWTDYKKTVLYNTYDITDRLKQGSNAIGILLGNGIYNIQPDTLRYVKFLTSFGQAKAIALLKLEYADGSTQLISTDRTWQAAPGPITYSNFYGGEDYDAGLDQAGWDRPGFKSKNWKRAVEIKGPGGSLKGLTFSAPPVKPIDTLVPVKITRIKDDLWIYDFGQNASMMPQLTVHGPEGSSVRMTPAELLGADGLVDRRSATQDGVRPAWWAYTLSGKATEQWFPKFFYQGARYLQVQLFSAGKDSILPTVTGLKDVVVHSSSTPVGYFECSDTLFNKIYNLVRWAQRSNMMSLMTDCPQREKMGWLEENNLNGPSLRYNFNMAPLFRKTMNDMADAQLGNGFVPNIAPEFFIAGPSELSNAMRNSPEWGSSFIIVPWQQYQFSGDVSLLERYYDRMKKYVGFLSSEAKDHIIYTGLGDWYDIGPKEPWGSQLTPVAFTATATYYYDNRIMADIARRLGKLKDAEDFQKNADRIRSAFNQKFFDPATGQYGTGSQTCSAMPLFFDLVEPENRQKLLDILVSDIKKRDYSFTTGEVGYRYLLRALADGGRSDIVFAMNNRSDKPGYAYQLKMGATSLTEKWDAGVGNFGSQNHFMSGQINEWFYNNLIGLAPDGSGPGFRRFTIKPDFVKDLNWVKGSFASLSGDINCEWRRSTQGLQVLVTVPANTGAVIYLPECELAQVSEGGKPLQKARGVTFKGKDRGKMKFELGSGTYRFEIGGVF